MIHLYLGLLLFSFLITSIMVVPFINLLYRLKFQRQKQTTLDFQNQRTPIFDKFHSKKTGTPVGGGLLVIVAVSILFLIIFPIFKFSNIFISIAFGLIGLYDDILKFFGFKRTGFFGLRMIHKLFLQITVSLLITLLIYFKLRIDFIYIPFFGALELGIFFIPISMGLIVGFANFFNITDGLDGLSCGLLMIALFAFWVLANTSFDTPISIFLSLWLGSIIAFLYFNIYPARVWLGDVGALSFGATFAVIALILGRVVPLLIIGSPFIIEGLSSAVQIISKKYFGKRIFPAAPIHLTLQKMGWEEPKIVTRAWLAGIILSIFGLWLGLN
ncbi:MAG: Phospho-N-acetylmuramoyl-pentapeptide-transferase [Candidatus Shapirobacteria bacterium GW2011_GWE2_38_30]|uniref:Phospho-N-acetylmuramoyl-pentapeptide-transferase n=1 Tax=Candidatus Shapirobacteria bacterium GW2011_GWE2_38_30 TaxID=1618490 RepID=A0A0G0JPV7_9BACT|nr:MAG: Phospho-N-acetylmuramoyl-pentapeptide-transferase [Candidatus Shapirobacteria bacterium GW2011_GWE2_38_30]